MGQTISLSESSIHQQSPDPRTGVGRFARNFYYDRRNPAHRRGFRLYQINSHWSGFQNNRCNNTIENGNSSLSNDTQNINFNSSSSAEATPKKISKVSKASSKLLRMFKRKKSKNLPVSPTVQVSISDASIQTNSTESPEMVAAATSQNNNIANIEANSADARLKEQKLSLSVSKILTTLRLKKH